jgi:transposase
MLVHANAKLGLAGRLALVSRIEEGRSLRAAADIFSVSPATAHRWWHRWIDGARCPQSLLDRSSRPQRSPRLLARELAERICACRRETGWGPRLVAGATGFAHSTVWRVLWRAGISRRAGSMREPAHRYEWPCPGDLLHMDVSRYARFERPGHAVTGDRSQRSRNCMRPGTRVGYDYLHAVVDDHSRLAYVELHDDEKAETVTSFVDPHESTNYSCSSLGGAAKGKTTAVDVAADPSSRCVRAARTIGSCRDAVPPWRHVVEQISRKRALRAWHARCWRRAACVLGDVRESQRQARGRPSWRPRLRVHRGYAARF